VACKAEHDVPLGVNRTWVKYIETGSFPDVDRHFSVMRCNHCDDAPCISICPTNALFRADNGVVDFNDDNCIGCKGCMNACPYDAIYINPVTNTANKCNFCNHRIDQGLEPSCVVVCPTHAIKVVDLDDPADETTALISRSETAVRAPEQNTKPKVHYRGADPASLDPLRTAIAEDGMIWADTTVQHPSADPANDGVEARTAYTTAHEMTWKAKVSSYLVTKAVAAGVMAMAVLQVMYGGHYYEQAAVGVMPPVVAGVFLAVTGVLLVGDLKRPERFYYLISRGNRRSWLVKGSWVLGAFASACAAWFIAGVAGWATTLSLLALPTVLLAAATAGYTAFLFGQCEGRDLWQSPVVLPTLLAQAAVAGAAAYAVADLVMDIPDPEVLRWVMLGGIGACAALVIAESASRGSAHVEAAVAVMTRGQYARQFWAGGVVLGLAVPAAFVGISLAVDSGLLAAVAGICAVAGMWCYEDSFVRAGQSVPLS
jgi:Fe-S-cluster-containing dehydrogenase component/formate-dependent nitrite reductase membrane component NrfD